MPSRGAPAPGTAAQKLNLLPAAQEHLLAKAAKEKKPDISILSDEFLAEVRNLSHKNLAVETLRKLLNNEIKIRSRKFLIQKATQTVLPQAELLCADWAV